MKMLNNYLICKVEEAKEELYSGFKVQDLNPFVELEVLYSEEQDIPVGSRVKVSSRAGEPDPLGIVIKRTDVIYVL